MSEPTTPKTSPQTCQSPSRAPSCDPSDPINGSEDEDWPLGRTVVAHVIDELVDDTIETSNMVLGSGDEGSSSGTPSMACIHSSSSGINCLSSTSASSAITSSNITSAMSTLKYPKAQDINSGLIVKDNVLSELLALVQQHQTIPIAPQAFMNLVGIVSNFALGSDLDRFLITRATHGKPMQLLLGMYRAMPHGMDVHPECCATCHLVLDSMLQLCHGGYGALILKAEAFKSRKQPECSTTAAKLASLGPMSSASTKKVKTLVSPTALLGELVQGARSALKHCRACAVPDLAWDGAVSAYRQGKEPSDPCGGKCTAVDSGVKAAGAARNSGDDCSLQANGSSLLEKWVRLLGASAASGKAAVRELYRRHIMDLLEDVLVVAASAGPPLGSGSPLGLPVLSNTLLEAVECVYGVCARQSQVGMIQST